MPIGVEPRPAADDRIVVANFRRRDVLQSGQMTVRALSGHRTIECRTPGCRSLFYQPEHDQAAARLPGSGRQH